VALIAGQLENKNYLTDLLFQQPVSESHRKMWLWNVFRAAGDPKRGHAIAIIDTDVTLFRQLDGGRSFWLRNWVRTELDLTLTVERIKHSDGVKSDVRKVLQNGFRYDVSTEPQDYESFYWTMYWPYAKQGFGGKAIYMTYEQMLVGMTNPELLRIKLGDEVIAGMVLRYPENGPPHWWVLGVRDGDHSLVKQGALAAIYYFGVMHLLNKGYHRAELGGVRPFLVDGVLQYKRKWGAKLLGGDDGDPRWFAVRLVDPTRALREFLKASPFICEDGQGIWGAVFADDNIPESIETARRRQAEMAALGNERVVVLPLPASDTIVDFINREIHPPTALALNTVRFDAGPRDLGLNGNARSDRH
jgi:hypothetical protein